MFNFFSSSSSKGRYPNPNRGGSHYQRGGFFRNFGSFSGSGSGRRRYNQNQQPYPDQGYAQQSAAQGSSQVCPNCGMQVPAGSKFCLSCGAKMNTAAFCELFEKGRGIHNQETAGTGPVRYLLSGKRRSGPACSPEIFPAEYPKKTRRFYSMGGCDPFRTLPPFDSSISGSGQ